MSERVARLAVNLLRGPMYNALPQDVQALFPQITDPIVTGNQDPVPNIVVGRYQDFGANAAAIIVTVDCAGPAESLVRQYRHLDLDVEVWVTSGQSPNVDGRRIASIIYEYIRRTLQDVNWSGNQISIQRSYETERSPILFEGQNKTYHISSRYRVEAISQVWY